MTAKKGKIDTNALLRKAGYSPTTHYNFGDIAKQANHLASMGLSKSEILTAIERWFEKKELLSMCDERGPCSVFGEPGFDFDYGVLDQMDTIRRLPVFKRGAILPDAHVGYALPIGGVAVFDNAVSPYCVGVDIACRMSMTVFEGMLPSQLEKEKRQLHRALKQETRFGFSDFSNNPRDHDVMYDPLWKDKSLPLRRYYDKARVQLGSSGGGNHFADLMAGITKRGLKPFGIPMGSHQFFTCLLTHSGSRGVGHRMATYYSKQAENYTNSIAKGIPKTCAWLDINTDLGKEYLMVMELMGRYAKANHDLIHKHFLATAGLKPLARVENHHNFAWVQDNGEVIHRKGATPAYKGQLGLIPGSSGTDSYLVAGEGNNESVNSCSHGAGRPFSRTEAKKRHDEKAFKKHMETNRIVCDGVAPDETFMAYKDIERVIEVQRGILVKVLAKMFPVVVRMGGKSDDGD